MRLLYLGTGPFAVPTLAGLAASSHEVAAVVTQPDRVARGGRRHPHPLREAAEEAGLPVLQPDAINTDEAIVAMAEHEADIIVTASYGQFLGKRVRQLTPHGAINLHGSILPKYRGAAPVQWAVWNRETESGVSVFQIERGMDTGPVFHVARCPVHVTDTSADLFERLAELAAAACLHVLDAIAAGNAVAVPQNESEATHARKLTKDDGVIDWTQPAERVRGQVLATQPWPKPSTVWHAEDGDRVLILPSVTPCDGVGQPGEVLAATDTLVVACGEGAIRIDRVQVAGKTATDSAAFLNGHRVSVGDRLG